MSAAMRPAWLLLGVTAACARSADPAPAPVASAVAAAPSVSVASAASEAAPPPSAAPSAPPAASSAPAAPLPAVKVENIGMHVGGGPNDDVTKAPIRRSVAPHFDELRACWAKVDDPARGGDFGVDLLIQPGGGRAGVSHPRTSIHPDAFRDCVVQVFEAIDFEKPRGGLTMVSYSLRFTP